MDNGINHVIYYFVELFVLLFGFFLMTTFSAIFSVELLILVMVLAAYILLGVLHHWSSHDLRRKIVIEYVLVSAIIFGAFLFLNAHRL